MKGNGPESDVGPTKTNTKRTVPLSDALRAWLVQHLDVGAKPDACCSRIPIRAGAGHTGRCGTHG